MNEPWICSNCREHNSNVNDLCANCGKERKEAIAALLDVRIDNTLDELHDLLVVWSRWRARQETPYYVRRAILMVIEEVYEVLVNQAPESPGAGSDSATARSPVQANSPAPAPLEAVPPAAAPQPAGSPSSAPDRDAPEPGS